MPRVQLSLLGPFRLVVHNQPVQRLRSVREAALLAYLAVEPHHPQPRDRLAGLLWPDHSATAARDNLKQILGNLRRTLDDVSAPTPILHVERQTVQFVPSEAIWLDVDHFRHSLAFTRTHAHTELAQCASGMAQLTRAVTLYQVPFRHNFTTGNIILFTSRLFPHLNSFPLQAMPTLARSNV